MDIDALHFNLIRWFREQGRDLPWRRTQDPYAIAVSEFMLQQTRVSAVIPYFARWMQLFPTVEALATASEEAVLGIWQGLGYYSRARNLHRLAQTIQEKFDGVFPREIGVLRSLPGVGEYTAAAILAFAFDLPAPVIDANIARVLSRWWNYQESIDTAKGKAFLQKSALDLQSQNISSREWNSAIMELGALLCTSGSPDCLLCPVRSSCQALTPQTLPRKAPRIATTRLEEQRAFILKDGQLWLEQSVGPRWRGLWILPLCNTKTYSPPLAREIYSITRYHVTMEIYLETQPFKKSLYPHALDKWADLPIAAPHRRAIALALTLV